ncbi:fructose-bisphosphate aldolase-like [Bactrocera dorsalis]|nr:fructose-bisphosphate aldolase-like [Bactrocera dorsalis]
MSTYFNYPSRSLIDELRHIAAELMKPGHGIVVTDESPSQLERLMEMFGINSSKEMRIQYRSLLFSVKQSLDEYVSGVAVHPEVLDQTTPNGCALHCQLRRKNVLVGVTVDKGLVPLLTTYGEYTTQGLDGLAGRCAEYKDCGCDFTMWRAQFNIGEYSPSYQAMMDNANNLAKFAAISQSKRMLPILEVDVVPSDDNDMERAEKVAETILIFIFKSLCEHHVNLEGTLLKFPALNAGSKCTKRYSPGQISKTTLRLLRHVVPASVGGIILHVDGKTEDKSLCLLNAAVIDPSPKPWPIIFSFDGILQSSIMMAWAGHCKNMQKGQQEFLKMLDAFSKAAQGAYVPGTMKSLADQCYCKRAFKALKTKPDPLPDDCVRYDEICRPPIVMPIAPAPVATVESAVVVAITAIKTEDTILAVGAATELVEGDPTVKVEEAKSTTEAAPEDAPTEQTENPPADSQ